MEIDKQSQHESRDAAEAARLEQTPDEDYSPNEPPLDSEKGQTEPTIEESIAQAGSRLSEGTFSLEHLEDFLGFIESKQAEMGGLETQGWVELYGVLVGIFAGLKSMQSELPDEVRPLKLQALRIILNTVSSDPSRLHHLSAEKDFLESLDLPSLLKSSTPENKKLARNFCTLLLYHKSNVTMTDLFQNDLESRDIISKFETRRLWKAMNTL